MIKQNLIKLIRISKNNYFNKHCVYYINHGNSTTTFYGPNNKIEYNQIENKCINKIQYIIFVQSMNMVIFRLLKSM